MRTQKNKTITISPKRKAIGIIGVLVVLALFFMTATAVLAFTGPAHVTTTLEGCRNDGSITLPILGKFICPDAAYTTGNLGKGWNELDLVPHRLTTDLGNQSGATTDYNVYIAGDYQTSGKIGWDLISEPEVNTAKSDGSCSVSAGPQSTLGSAGNPFGGGTDVVIYRLLTIHQDKGTTCVFDYYQRLALGAHLYPGSSLQSYLGEQDGLAGSKKTISIPVNEIMPQELDKDMTATQGTDHVWDITKSATPATLSFADTCATGGTAPQSLELTISWTKEAANPSGPITVTTHVYATNPASRVITTNVTDVIYSGTDPLNTASSGPKEVPANTANFLVLDHTYEAPSSTTNLNDIATATYTDKVTGIPVPGTTTATASALVDLSGSELNQTAIINDVESITGSYLSFSADSFSGADGAFDDSYVAGTETTDPVSWTSDSQSGSGSVKFNKKIYVSQPSIVSGKLSDTATLTGSDGASADSDLDVNISTNAKVSLTINKTIPDILSGNETETFTFQVKDSKDEVVASPSITFSAGQTSKSVTVSDLAPGSYTVNEDPAAGWNAQSGKTATISLPSCSGSVNFSNDFAPASANVKKVTIPAGEEAGWEFTLTGPGGSEKVTTSGAGFIAFTTELQEGSYTITETPKAGFDQTDSSGDCSFIVNYPADSGKLFSCTYQNTKRGHIIVDKVTNPSGNSQSFDFTADFGNFSLKDTDTPHDSGALVPGTYSVSETVPSGWDQTSATCDDGSDPSTISLQAGETVTCTFTNTERGTVTVVKTFLGQVITGSEAFEFQLRQGASANSNGTVLDTQIADSTNGGTIGFEVNGTTKLIPGDYQLCEFIMVGWDSTIRTMSGAFVPNSSADPATTDNAYVCVPFTLDAGGEEVFNIDNAPPPGGMAKTIGFWKNWSSCSGGNQDPILDETLESFLDGGVDIGDLFINECLEATRILNKSDVSTDKKKANDAAYALAAQLLAAKLNIQAGAGWCPATTEAIDAGQELLDQINFDGTGDYLGPRVKGEKLDLRNEALDLANTLDQYNNNLLCGSSNSSLPGFSFLNYTVFVPVMIKP